MTEGPAVVGRHPVNSAKGLHFMVVVPIQMRIDMQQPFGLAKQARQRGKKSPAWNCYCADLMIARFKCFNLKEIFHIEYLYLSALALHIVSAVEACL